MFSKSVELHHRKFFKETFDVSENLRDSVLNELFITSVRQNRFEMIDIDLVQVRV